MGYNTPFEGSGIHHSSHGLQITHDMYIKGFFLLAFDLNPDRAASEGHTSHLQSGSIRVDIRVDIRYSAALTEAATCLLYLQYDNCVRIDQLKTV
jgi:hypothetical protein